jgi:CxxC-x17-CxxC domain-containing protein
VRGYVTIELGWNWQAIRYVGFLTLSSPVCVNTVYTELLCQHTEVNTWLLTRKGENTENMADKTLTCRDCGNTFDFTEGEQAFYAQKGFSEPTRCPSCRASKKANRNSGYGDSYGSSSGGYGSGSSYGSSSSSGGYGGGSGYSRERTMTTVTCANCNKETQVPFVPRGDKPVYCSDCYNTVGAGASKGNGGGGRSRY